MRKYHIASKQNVSSRKSNNTPMLSNFQHNAKPWDIEKRICDKKNEMQCSSNRPLCLVLVILCQAFPFPVNTVKYALRIFIL